MRLKGDRKRFSNATLFLRKLALKMFNDPSKTISYQDPEVVGLFLKEAVEQYPFFESYEDAWPVSLYLKSFLRTAAYRRRRACQAPVLQPEKSVTCERTEGHPRTSRCTTLSQTKSSLQPRTTRSASDRSETPSAEDTKAFPPCRPLTQVSRSKGFEAPPACAPSIAKAEVPRSLHSFLQTVEPLLTAAVPSFISAGIFDEEAFRTVAGWPDDERDTFLSQDVKLSPFHFRLTRILLTRLRQAVVIVID